MAFNVKFPQVILYLMSKQASMTFTVGLKEASFYAFHGYYEEERKMGNHFIINTKVGIDVSEIGFDDIVHTVNYETLYQICKNEMEQSQKLLETVAANILHAYKNNFPDIKSASITIEKLQPQLGGKLQASYVELMYENASQK